MTRPYQTKSFEIGSTIKTKTGIDPDIYFDDQGIATLEFPMNQAVIDVVMGYESGRLLVEPRTLLTVRNQLYRRIRGGAR